MNRLRFYSALAVVVTSGAFICAPAGAQEPTTPRTQASTEKQPQTLTETRTQAPTENQPRTLTETQTQAPAEKQPRTLTETRTQAPAAPQAYYSLHELLETADRESRMLSVSEKALDAAEEGLAAAKAAMLPTVGLSLQGSYTGNAFLLSRGFSTSGTTDYVVPGTGVVPIRNGKQDTPHWGNGFIAQVSQVIYAGGAMRSGIRMAEIGKEMAGLDVDDKRQEARFLVAGYYLDLCKLNNQIDVVEQNMELTRKVIAQMEARLGQGTALKNDLTRYEFQIQSLELTRTKLRNAAAIINNQLVTMLHLPEDTVVATDSEELEYECGTLSPSEEEQNRRKAYDGNIGIRKAGLAVDLAAENLRQARAASLPSVALVAENHLIGPYTSDLIPKDCNVNVWFVGLGVKYSLSSIWKNNHPVRKAAHEYRRSSEEFALAREGLSNGVDACFINLQTAVEEVRTQEKQVELAAQNYEVVRNRYDNDLALLTDMLDASNLKLSADMALVNSRIDMLYCHFKLKYIAGTL